LAGWSRIAPHHLPSNVALRKEIPMKKVKNVQKIVLSKETLRQLDERQLPAAVAGAYTENKCAATNAKKASCLSNCQC
jgi:hypothetical protein